MNFNIPFIIMTFLSIYLYLYLYIYAYYSNYIWYYLPLKVSAYIITLYTSECSS